MSSDLIGKQIAHYRIDRLIGAGGMGTVYEAYDLDLQRSVALKLMHPQIASQPEFRQRLKTEARTAAMLDHPSIVKIYNFGQSNEDGGLYVAMEYIKDGSLRDHLRRAANRNVKMDTSLALQVGVQIADALHHAHSANVIHRDVKPGNIILKRLPRAEEAGFAPFRAVLTDFGLVQVINHNRVTQTGITMGTPVYMSPEQCEDESLGGRTDIYSLGVVIYEMLAGRPPFTFSTLSQAIRSHIRNEQPRNIREIRSDVPPLIDAILSRALAKRPDERFVTAGEMAETLRTAYFSVSDTPTRIWHSKQISDPSSIQLTIPPRGYQLLVRTHGRDTVDGYELTNPQYTFGRSADNDLVLANESVSRHHALLEFTDRGWIIRALPGLNGTFINGRRLRPGQPMRLFVGEPLRVGPYEIVLDGPPDSDQPVAPQPLEEPEPLRVQAPTQSSPQPTVVSDPQPVTTPDYEIFLDSDSLVLEVGQPTEVIAEVVNHTAIDDRVRLKVHGLPENWVTLPSGFEQLPAGQRTAIGITVVPTRRYDAVSGRQRFRVELVSQRNRDAKAGVSGEFEFLPFESFEAYLSPDEINPPDSLTVSVTNTGNMPADYSVTVRETDGMLMFDGEVGRVRIDPGGTALVDIEVDWARSPFVER